MYNPYVDDTAEEVAQDGEDDVALDDEDSTDEILRRMDDKDFDMQRICGEFEQQLACPPTPRLGRGRVALPELYSRAPTPLALYKAPPIVGSRAPTPRYVPASETPFLPMSDDEADADIARPGRPSPSASSTKRARTESEGMNVDAPASRPQPRSSAAPPAKRPRLQPANHIIAQAKRFIDLEAQEADSEEEDDEDATQDIADFINDDDDDFDDEPIHDPEQLHRQQLRETQIRPSTRAPKINVQALEEEAARYKDMARRARPSIPVLQDPSSPHVLASVFPHQADPEMYRFTVPPRTEMSLLVYLMKVEGICSVFSRGHGTGAVYVETTNFFNLRRSINRYPGAYRMRNSLPADVSVEERVSALTLSPSASPIGRWARVRAGTLIYKNDLVFVEDESHYLVVPRVPYDQSDRTSSIPSQKIFDPDAFRAANPGEQLQKRNKLWIWNKRIFVEGLEERMWKQNDLTFDEVIPTEEEREMFAQSLHSSLEAAPFVGRCCALQEGDRVVVVAGELSGKTGHIKILEERGRMRFAAVVPEIGHQNREAFTVAVRCLRLHALAPLRHMSLGDRVVVIAGNASQGSSGRVESISDQGLVSFTPLSVDVNFTDDIDFSDHVPPTLEVEMRHVRVDFRLFDVVEIVRGEKKGIVGFITALHEGGSVDFYPCTIPQLIAIKTNDFARDEETHDVVLRAKTVAEPFSKSGVKMQDPTYRAEQYSIVVATVDLKFAPIDGETHGYRINQEGSVLNRPQPFGYSSTALKAAADARALDESRRDWIRDIMGTGRRYIGCEVRVVGQTGGSGKKGQYAAVKGYTFMSDEQKKARENKTREKCTGVKGWVEPSLEGLEDVKDAMVHIQYENSPQLDDVPLKHLQERHSGLPLVYAVYFKTVGPKYSRMEPQIEVGPLVSAAEAWPETSSAPEPILPHIFGRAPDIGESSGHWFAGPQFVKKRLDVMVQGVGSCVAKYGAKINPRTYQCEGAVGFITPFSKPYNTQQLDRQLVDIRKQPLQHPAKIPAPALKPLRRTDIDPSSGTDSCISAIVGRVIIIGSDVTGNDDRRGHYAETVPASLQYGTPIVEVRFQMESGVRPPNRHYHLECLCRAKNEPLSGFADVPVTVF